MLRLVAIVFACTLIIAGFIVFPMPIPLGAFMIATGLVLMISVSTRVAAHMRLFRRRHRRTNAFIQKIEDKMPGGLKRILRRTDP